MSSIRLHERIRSRSQIDDLSQLSDVAMPLFAREPFEFQVYLSSMHRLLRKIITDQPISIPQDQELRDIRSRLSNILNDHAEKLNEPDEREARWTRAMLIWVVICQLNVVIHALWKTDSSDLTAFRSTTNPELVNQRVCVFDAPVMSYKMSELMMAIDVLRSRLNSITAFGGDLVRYVIALECRASMLVACGHDVAVLDVPDYRRSKAGNVLATCHIFFVPYTLWAFVWIKRFIRMYTTPTLPHFQPLTIMRGIPSNWRLRIDDAKAKIDDFVRGYAKSMKTDEYARNFKKRAYAFETWPGEREACTFRYGGNTEKSTDNDILSTQRPLDATAFLAHSKYKQDMSSWLSKRAPLGDSHAFLQQFAFLHIIDCFLRGRMNVPFLKWCVVLYLCQRESTNYLERIARAFQLKIPFITQRLGRYAVIVPQYTERRFDRVFGTDEGSNGHNSLLTFTSSDSRTPSISRPVLSDDEDESHDNAQPLFMDDLDAETAFAIWAIAMLCFKDGVLHGSVSIKPFLESVLLGTINVYADDAAQSVQGDI